MTTERATTQKMTPSHVTPRTPYATADAVRLSERPKHRTGAEEQ
jgi:hypothetical protein